MKLVVVGPDIAPVVLLDDGEVTCRPDPERNTVDVEFRATFTLDALECLAEPRALMGIGGAIVLAGIDSLRAALGDDDVACPGPAVDC